MIIVCAQCEKPFDIDSYSVKQGQKYCSQQCHAASRVKRVTLTCEICREHFSVKPNVARKGRRRYCSIKCRGIASGIAQSKRVTRTCAICGKTFERSPCYATWKNVYCSRDCNTIGMMGKGSPFWRGGKHEEATCEFCGKKFMRWPSKGNCKRYCSKLCVSKSITLPDEVKEYPTTWNDDLLNKVRDRDGHECIICGKPETDRVHCVHHINYLKRDIRNSNLISLCTSCHGKTSYNRDYWQTRLSSFMGMLGYC